MSSAAMAGEEKTPGGGGAHLWPGQNSLQLSVGCSDDEDSADEWNAEDQLRARYTQFLQARMSSGGNGGGGGGGPSCLESEFAEDRMAEAGSPEVDVDDFVVDQDEGPTADMMGADFSLSALRDVFGAGCADGRALFQPIADTNFVEEVWREKPPKILRGYLFGSVLGEGSYARVKEVVEEATLVRRAVKIVKTARLRKIPNGVENVERELKILSAVRHPNVIRMLESFRIPEKQKLYMVLEYCVTNLQLLVDTAPKKHLGEFQSQTYMKQLVAGLDYLHSQGIVHKDIKPGNLLLALDSTLRISDFGTAEQLERFAPDDRCQLSQGTPKFQPPEVVSGSAPDFRGFPVDVWAAGITLYNLLSGEYPFNGDVIMRLFQNIANQPLAMPTNVQVGKDAESLLRGLLEKDPDRRWSLAQVKSSDWFRRAIPLEEKTWINACGETRPLTVLGALEQLYGQEPPGEGDVTMAEAPEAEEQQPLQPVPPPKVIPPPRRNRSFLSMCLRSPSSP